LYFDHTTGSCSSTISFRKRHTDNPRDSITLVRGFNLSYDSVDELPVRNSRFILTSYRLELNRRSLHGHFSRDLEPVLEIDAGDSVEFDLLDARWYTKRPNLDGSGAKFEPMNTALDAGHALCGPVLVRGAKPGMTLGIRVDALTPGAWGWQAAGGWQSAINERLGMTEQRGFFIWDIDTAAGLARLPSGFSVPLQPFLGVMGVATSEAGNHSTSPPRVVGGNLDCRELVVGSTLFLPIEVAGALFSTGDGHAAQGDGEASGTAIECPMQAKLTFSLHDDLKLQNPYALTPVGEITFGLHEALWEACAQALEGMIGILVRRHQLAREEAFALVSAAVDLRVTQIANGVNGVHALLRPGAIGSRDAKR
jgi:acetamidase/formamidase